MRRQAIALAAGLTVLAAGLIAVAVLGPLVTTTIQYRYSPTMLNQATGLDAFALAVVAPLALLAAVLVVRRHRAAPLVALAPAGFALYMLVQYVIGPEYLLIEGNGERAFLLFAALFVVSASVMAQAWSHAETPPWSYQMTRRRGAILLALAFFVVAGMYLANGFLSAMWDFPSYIEGRMAVSEYDEHPTAYWIVAFLDLAVVVPLTVATGVGLLRRRGWARRAFYGVVGWYGLVPASVAAMALTMLARNDPAAQGTKAIVLTVAAAVSFALAITVFLPLFRAGTWVQLSAERAAPESASIDDWGRVGAGHRQSACAGPISSAQLLSHVLVHSTFERLDELFWSVVYGVEALCEVELGEVEVAPAVLRRASRAASAAARSRTGLHHGEQLRGSHAEQLGVSSSVLGCLASAVPRRFRSSRLASG